MKVHAEIHVAYGGCKEFAYYWTACVFGVRCTKQSVYYQTVASAKRAGRQWCKRVGFDYTVTVDKGIRT